jgi:hypothetical protein
MACVGAAGQPSWMDGPRWATAVPAAGQRPDRAPASKR